MTYLVLVTPRLGAIAGYIPNEETKKWVRNYFISVHDGYSHETREAVLLAFNRSGARIAEVGSDSAMLQIVDDATMQDHFKVEAT